MSLRPRAFVLMVVWAATALLTARALGRPDGIALNPSS